MLSWLKRIFSSDSDASYGRCISFMAYLGLAIFPYVILRNYTILNESPNATNLIKTVIQYMFYLSALGYCASGTKDVLLGIFKSPENVVDLAKKVETTIIAAKNSSDSPEKIVEEDAKPS